MRRTPVTTSCRWYARMCSRAHSTDGHRRRTARTGIDRAETLKQLDLWRILTAASRTPMTGRSQRPIIVAVRIPPRLDSAGLAIRATPGSGRRGRDPRAVTQAGLDGGGLRGRDDSVAQAPARFLACTSPFGVVEAIWTVIGVQRYRARCGPRTGEPCAPKAPGTFKVTAPRLSWAANRAAGSARAAHPVRCRGGGGAG